MFKTIGPLVFFQSHQQYLNVLLKNNLVNILKSISTHISQRSVRASAANLSQSVLMAILIEEWRNALDRNENVAAILMDLSKAFSCLPHDLITENLRAYGLSNDAVELIHDYLSNH